MQFQNKNMKIAFGVSILLAAVCLFLSFLMFSYVSNTMKSKTTQSLEDMAKQSAKYVNEGLQVRFKALEAIAATDMMKSSDIDLKDKIAFLKSIETSQGFLIMAIADLNGYSTATVGRAVNISNWDYYKQAAAGENSITEPSFYQGSTTIICISVPIKNNGKVESVLIGITDGKMLSDMTNSIKYGKSGKVFMIGKTGTIIADEKMVRVRNMDNDIEKVKKDDKLVSLVALEKQMIAGKNGTGEYEYNGVSEIMGFAPVGATGWSLAVTVPKGEAYEGISNLLPMEVALSGIVILLGAVILFMTVSSTKPR